MVPLLIIAAALLQVQDNPRGYYKDIFMDSGIMLTSRTDLPVSELLGLSLETFVSTPYEDADTKWFTSTDTLRQRELIAGSPIDENGILLYPDGAPRFRMVYMNGGRAHRHAVSLEEGGRLSYRDFVASGGSYLGSCAGAYIASLGAIEPDSPLPKHTESYLGLWPGYAVSTQLVKSYTAVDLVPGSPLVSCFDFDGRMHIDSLRHNGGCFARMEDAPSGTEVLVKYSTRGRDLEKDIHGLPCVWAYKASPEAGRVILCGSHPEGSREGYDLALMAALVRYAFDGNGGPRLKAELKAGEPREMKAGTSRKDPSHARIGDLQYHHFCIDVPKGAKRLVATLEGVRYADDFDLRLFISRKGFAFSDNSPWCNIAPGVDKSLEIKDPAPGKYYISVFCATTVTSSSGKYGVEYSGRTDVLNGVPYTIRVDLE